MRILITGCGGMLGEAVYAELQGHKIFATDIDLNEPWLEYLDVRDPDAIDQYIGHCQPEVVLHLAALTDMEYCELHPMEAYDTNFMGTYHVVRAAARRVLPVFYISSAGVFDGRQEKYSEYDLPNPLNVYAKSKMAGEVVASAYTKSTVIRAGWMMGGGPKKDKKFINKIIKQIRAGATELHVVEDKHGTPTYTYDLAKMMHQLLHGYNYGMYHVACAGGGSRVDVARAIMDGLGTNGTVKLCPVGSDYFQTEYFATRPFSEKLVSQKLPPLRDWQECLRDYLGRFEW